MSGWQVGLGDAILAMPGASPVTVNDIATTNEPGYSQVEANIHHRQIMAHNITFYWVNKTDALTYAYRFTTEFRLVYPPSTTDTQHNVNTLEANVGVYDGSTHIANSCGIQWALDPWYSLAGIINEWTTNNTSPALWEPMTSLIPDANWHTLDVTFDPPHNTCSYTIDGVTFTALSGHDQKPSTWSSENAANVQVEVVSINPADPANTIGGEEGLAQFKDWTWTMTPPSP